MKKITLFFIWCFGVLFSANASIIIDETFNYTETNLENVSAWTTTGTLTTGTGRNIESGGLVYSNGGGTYIYSGTGNKINQDYSAGSNYISYRSFSTVSSGVIYLSYLYQANGDQGQTASEVLGLSNSSTNSAVKIWAGKQSDGTKNPFRIGLTRSSTTSADIVWSSDTYSTSNVYLIVIKYDFATTTASVFIDPVLGTATEPSSATITAASDGTARTSLAYLMFKHNGSSIAKFYVSGVRVSTSWAEAVAVQSTAPQLSTPTVGAATDITSDGFTANWSTVSNATGYDVKVYLEGNLVGTTNFSDQTTSSGVITGLMSGMSYTYTVIAKGDVTNYNDSDPSDESSSITTLDPYASNAIVTDLSDASWGTPEESLPTTGSYPSSIINGFDLSSAVLYTGSTRCIKGITHTNRIAIDKLAYGGMVTLPTVNSVEQIEIHATAGTAGNGFILEEFIPSTNTWSAIGGTNVYEAASKDAGTDSVYIFSVSRTTPTKFRVRNPSNGAVFLLQVITRTTDPTLLDIPTINDATEISSTGFKANWTAVSNSSGYKVYVYEGSSLITGAPFSASGQATESLIISSLSAETLYTYRVQAIGDGDIYYSDSFLSDTKSAATSVSTATSAVLGEPILQIDGKTLIASEVGNFLIYNIQGQKIVDTKSTKSINLDIQRGLYVISFIGNSGQKAVQKISIK